MLAPPAPAPLSPAQGEPSLALPRSFWKDFAKRYWDREPVLFRGLFQAHFPSTEEIFAAAVEASARSLRDEYPPMSVVRFFVEHEDSPDGMPYYSLIFPLTKKHLPLPEDRSANDYVERVTRNLGGKRFGLVLNRAQCHHWGHWLQMRSFLSGFHEAVGVPLGLSDSCVFFGNYLYTPFGVHKDDLHIFYFVVEGQKTMSMWPFELLSGREEVPKDPGFIHRPGAIALRDKADEKQVLAQATTLVGRAGDLMYWPASYWHRAEPSQGLAISASLGVNFQPPEFAGRAPKGQWPGRLRHTELPGSGAWRVPASVRKSIQQRTRREELLAAEREQLSDWTRYLTAGALLGSPPEATGEAPLTPKEWIRTSPQRPIVAVSLPKGQVLLSANGHSTTLSPSPTVRRRIDALLKALNSGKPQHVEALEEAFFTRLTARGFNTRAFRSLLQDLVRWRAVSRCEPLVARR
ncbi:hypothetical protein DAT35_34110 [Vitiosangium sp. GDMCC 1.1324]|nr:hypothetical protein DAT35_34110 [Vitiosangium sp. GDMCC 1.1324]